ncbi:MAG: HEAT repeat domain-containing protein, partial [Bryobacteraceae bacterium]
MIVATALVTGPDAVRTSPFGGPAHPALIFLQMLLILAVCIVPVLLGIQAAQRKGVSPHWMWFGLNPLGGWLAYLIIRYGVRSKLRPAAGSRSSLIARDDVVICGHCNQASPWSANWVQDRTRGTPFARPAAPLDMHWRNFCPKCGYLIADTVDLSGRRAWVGGARPAIYDLQPEGVAGKPIVGDEYLVPYGRNVFDLKGYLGELAHEEQVWRDTPAQSTDELIAAVNGADPVLRKAAAVELGNRREASAAASLVKAFEREDGSGQVTYEEALRKIGAPAVAPLSGALNSPQWFVRYRSTWTLKEMVRQSGDPLLLRTFCDVALPSLRHALHDANAHVSRVAAEALELAARRAPDQEAPPRNEEPAGSRVHVGECEKCGHPLKVKAHAVRPAMRLTCRCGHTFELRVPDAILTSRPVVEARAAQAPVLAQPVGDDQLLHESVDRLLYLYRTHPAGFSPAERDECVQEIRRIGEALDRRGGFDLML